MIGLLRTYLNPYRWPLLLVMGLLLVQAIANLYLPELNADIINNGVAKGDTDYILRTGGFMLAVTFALAIAAVIATFTWRRTGSSLPGALICGMFVTWYVVAGTATQAAF